MCYMIIKNKYPNLSPANIGELFGGHDRATVIHGLSEADYLKTTDKIFRDELNHLIEYSEIKVSKIKYSTHKLKDLKEYANKITRELANLKEEIKSLESKIIK